MSDDSAFRFDWQRNHRSGVPEVVFAQGKSTDQLIEILEQALAVQSPLFMTRVNAEKAELLTKRFNQRIHYHSISGTLRIAEEYTQVDSADVKNSQHHQVGVVAAGTSDLPLVSEIEESLQFLGVRSARHIDVGVAGLWRLMELSDKLNRYPVLIAVAGMEGALFSVLAGLVKAPVIAVPSSVGYGVTANGHTALHSALGSCAPGIAVVNIDNGFGAAALAVKILSVATCEGV